MSTAMLDKEQKEKKSTSSESPASLRNAEHPAQVVDANFGAIHSRSTSKRSNGLVKEVEFLDRGSEWPLDALKKSRSIGRRLEQ